MNRKIAVIIAVIALVVVIIFAWHLSEQPASIEMPNVSSSTAQNSSTSGTATSSPSSTSTATSTGVSISGTPGLTVTVSPSGNATSTSWQTYSGPNHNLTISYPPSWSVDLAWPLSIDNFNHKYYESSIIPDGGAEIDVTTTTIYESLQSFVAGQLSGASITSTSTVSVDGAACAQYIYNDTYAPSFASKNIAVYCPHHGALFEIYLSYRADDPNGAQYPMTFAEVLSKFRFGN